MTDRQIIQPVRRHVEMDLGDERWSSVISVKPTRADGGGWVVVVRASERGNFSHLLLSFSLERHKVPFRIGFLPFYVSPPPSPHLIASAFTAASHPTANIANLCSQTKKNWAFACVHMCARMCVRACACVRVCACACRCVRES